MKANAALRWTCFAQFLLASHVVHCTSKLKVAIVNEDAKQTDSRCTYFNTCSLQQLSCRFLAHLHAQPVSETYHPDLDSTVRALNTKVLDASAIIHMNENFTDAFVAKMALEDLADEETIESGQIHVWLPNTEHANTLRGYLETAFDAFVQDLMSACGYPNDRFTFKHNFNYHFISRYKNISS